MIIYGTNGSHRRTQALPGLACPACATPDALHLSVFSRYTHIYWVPLFPYSKPVAGQCGHCQRVWEEKELPGELKPLATALKKETSAPWWQWVGLALLALGIGWALIANNQDEKDNAAYLAAPQVGDVYTVRSQDSVGAAQYSLLKVVSARGNTVELVTNEYVTNDVHPLSRLNDPEKYSRVPFSLTYLDLQVMLNKGELTDVDRLGQ
ncbi:hypothetical protein LGH70_06490 [Hymenobacter sp. BT635]|uniref:Zinc-ribbon 15 domain-containing protein n=1 Tax=Hymenobacter nitidus TaxID=2880929 RepID=A0ABS8A9Z7_9BACT|nr:hypothetical protein [Hymenobacter nitidus]MCB2377222.1 hypothetical protein [Hymenobacter nitidus]